MKKIFILTFLVLFMCGAVYLLFNEGKSKSKHVRESRGYYAKFISEKPKSMIKRSSPTRELRPFELQRQRINSESIYHFEDTESKESYEMDETELEKFNLGIKKIKDSGSVELVHPIDQSMDSNNEGNKKYYHYDHE
ncbi:MAG: hypothetical protein K2Q18_04880 [Bdellovibrionales bacterium]|nr:hypothetical protein [Bdellovibrionales bacterium]